MLNKVSIKNRIPYITLSRGILSVEDNGFCFIQKDIKILIPAGEFLIIFIEPGVSLSHRVVELAAKLGTLLIFISEGGTRLYSMGSNWSRSNANTLFQAEVVCSQRNKQKVLNEMFKLRFGEYPPKKNLTEDQLRGYEGARVKTLYDFYSKQYGVEWKGRKYERNGTDLIHFDKLNQAITHANFALYSVTEAVIRALGYSPALGFMHKGNSIAFVLDIADILKFETSVPLAFRIVKNLGYKDLNAEVRLACRDMFKEENIIEKIINIIEEVFKPIRIKENDSNNM